MSSIQKLEIGIWKNGWRTSMTFSTFGMKIFPWIKKENVETFIILETVLKQFINVTNVRNALSVLQAKIWPKMLMPPKRGNRQKC
jgi:hypothetical protein